MRRRRRRLTNQVLGVLSDTWRKKLSANGLPSRSPLPTMPNDGLRGCDADGPTCGRVAGGPLTQRHAFKTGAGCVWQCGARVQFDPGSHARHLGVRRSRGSSGVAVGERIR